jgi:hypothetical protein
MANLKTKLSVSIDLSKIDKSRIVSTDKNGKPYDSGAKYYNIDIIVFNEANQYGSDVMVSEGQTKEERDNKVKSNIIGNGKTVYQANQAQESSAVKTPQVNNQMPPPSEFMSNDELPF